MKDTIRGVFGAHYDKLYLNGKLLNPAESLKLRNHSPDGFSWGYLGSGCAQTALALLLEKFGSKIALAYYQQFKEEIIAPLPQSSFEIEVDMEAWLKEKEVKK